MEFPISRVSGKSQSENRVMMLDILNMLLSQCLVQTGLYKLMFGLCNNYRLRLTRANVLFPAQTGSGGTGARVCFGKMGKHYVFFVRIRTFVWQYCRKSTAQSRDDVKHEWRQLLTRHRLAQAGEIPNTLWHNILPACRPQSFHESSDPAVVNHQHGSGP